MEREQFILVSGSVQFKEGTKSCLRRGLGYLKKGVQKLGLGFALGLKLLVTKGWQHLNSLETPMGNSTS